jgi:serine/threonine-protein kinase
LNGAVAQYEIVDRLGEGGLGEAFRGRDTRLGRSVAIKRVADAVAADPGARARLITAAQRLQGLSHPHIAELYEVVEEGDALFLVFEYVDGETLARTIGGRPLNPRRAAELASQIADALAEAHAAGVLHLDLRPDTVLVSRKGRPKILDLGLSDFTRAGALRRRAAEGAPEAAASLGYMSPEQALGENEDGRSDVFSLGVMFYEMLTGEAPFASRDAGGTVVSVLHTAVAPPSERNPAVPRYFDAVVARMLAKSLHGRYGTAAAAAAELRGLAERKDAPPPSPARPVAAPTPRSWLLPVAVAAVIAGAGVIWWMWGLG